MSKTSEVSRRDFLKILGGASMGALLASCNAPATIVPTPLATSAPQLVSTQEPTGKLVVWAWDLVDTAFKSAIPTFQTKYPNVEIDVVSVPWDQIHSKLTASIETGTGGPDVCVVEGYYMPSYARPGVVDLTERIAPYREDIAKAKLTELLYDGKVWALPWDFPPALMLYRPEILEAAGASEMPATWDELLEVGKEIVKGGDRYLFAMDPAVAITFYWYRPLLSQIGSGYFDADGNVILGDEKSVRVLKWMYDAIHTHKVAMTGVEYFEGPSWWSALKDDRVATIFGAPWMVGMMKEQAPEALGKWRVAPLPVFDAGNPTVASLGGSSVLIPEQTKNLEAAWAYVEHLLLTKEGNIKVYETTGIWPSYLPALEDKIFDEEDEYFGGQHANRMFADATKDVGLYYFTRKMVEAERQIVRPRVSKILAGEEDLESGIKAAADELRNLIG